jgi:hypothetical protein
MKPSNSIVLCFPNLLVDCYLLFVDVNPDTLKSKKSELRLYCDLLMQQVHMVKTAVTQEGGPEVQVRRDRFVC